MNELPPELIDVCFKYVSNANLYKLYLTSWECHVLSSLHLKHCKYAMLVSKEGEDIIRGPAMNYLAYKGDLQGVKYLHSIGKDCTHLAMDFAVVNGHWEVIKYLYSIGKNCTINVMSYAASHGHLNVVKYLHSIGRECTTKAIDLSAASGHLEVVKYLHSIGKNGSNPIYWAKKYGHTEVVKFLKSIKK